jgi:hypothetical protein
MQGVAVGWVPYLLTYCRSQCSKFKKQLPPPRCLFPILSPSCGHGGLEGGFLCRKDKPSWLHKISTSEVGDRRDKL